ncbi:hypothetical protein MLD38_019560 [Melastoma candidum]|uniref:Uncharacterized protein n=1 Tax=Melastoma candidum TaxID=119954 RepID=A0ACB9QXE5_9MYRT|nr:hypothetical protein MLD38_019560 [Melastoma candidum]
MDAGNAKPFGSNGADTAPVLQSNSGRAANLRLAANDDDMTNIVKQIKSSKSPGSIFSRLLHKAVVNYGAAWCRVCSQILPAFVRFVDEFPKLSFVYADIDECPETTQHVRYTPTFHFYRDGERVDEMFGAGEERLRDRLWLHS